MKTSPRMSVLGEGGDPCIAGNKPLEDHKTEFFPVNGFPTATNSGRDLTVLKKRPIFFLKRDLKETFDYQRDL